MSPFLWPTPFWNDGPRRTLAWRFEDGNIVEFQAAVVGQPASCDAQLPLIFYFAGLGSRGGLGEVSLATLSSQTPSAFVIVAPIRPKGLWWPVDDDREWGFCDGAFQPTVVGRFGEWMQAISNDPGINRRWISAWGFSAGAYGLSEFFSTGVQVPLFRSLVLGGLHGHGQPDLDGVQGSKRLQCGDAIVAKWEAYIHRIREHPGVPGNLICVHHKQDQKCPWRYTELIIQALNDRQRELGYKPVSLEEAVLTGRNRLRSCHAYGAFTFYRRELLETLLPPVHCTP